MVIRVSGDHCFTSTVLFSFYSTDILVHSDTKVVNPNLHLTCKVGIAYGEYAIPCFFIMENLRGYVSSKEIHFFLQIHHLIYTGLILIYSWTNTFPHSQCALLSKAHQSSVHTLFLVLNCVRMGRTRMWGMRL